MPITYGSLDNLKQEIADRLLSIPFFADIPVIGKTKGLIVSEIDQKLAALDNRAGKGGVCCIVMVESGSCPHPDIYGPHLEDIKIRILVVEKPNINRDDTTGIQKTNMAVVENIIQNIHQWKPDSLSSPIICESPAFQPFESAMDEENFVCNAKCDKTYYTALIRVETPEILVAVTESGSTMSMTCSTPGAAIFYTTNGYTPSPRTGTLYTAPITTPTPGTLIRVRAWLAGYETSEENTLTI